tara:strand:- start:18 stop:656 length:639 start_codon:yes stop_codon:yes gene_type:complete
MGCSSHRCVILCNPGRSKANHNPDLVVLAALAARAGADLRVLVLHRPAEDVLTSTTVHRSFGAVEDEARTLRTSAEALASQLHALQSDQTDRSSPATFGNASWLCVPFERVGDAAWWSTPAAGAIGRVGAARLAVGDHDIDTSEARSHWLHPSFSGGSAAFAAMLSALRGSGSGHGSGEEAHHEAPTSEVVRAAVELSKAVGQIASAAHCYD